MKSKIIVKSIVLLIMFCLTIFILINMNKKPSKLKDISNYRIYYRKIDKSILKSMSVYDLNIVEGSFFDKSDVYYLHDSNSKAIGYYSVMEIGSWDASFIEKLDDTDYLRINGSRVLSKSEKNYIGDISNTHFQDALIEAIEERVIDKNMDGIFLDTVDWIDYYKDDEILYQRLLTGYSQFLQKIKEKHPNLIIIQNRGFYCYERISYKYIDGILWENFSSPYVLNDTDKVALLEHFDKITSKHNTTVFTISFDAGDQSSKLSKELGWIHLQSPMENRYSSWDIETKS